MIAHWPKGIKAQGELRQSVGHVIDIDPTVLELAGVDLSTFADDSAPSLPGASLMPAFSGDDGAETREVWWLHEGRTLMLER